MLSIGVVLNAPRAVLKAVFIGDFIFRNVVCGQDWRRLEGRSLLLR